MAKSAQEVLDLAIKMLKTADGQANENESQTAFLMVQQMLMKHNIDIASVRAVMDRKVEAGTEVVDTVITRQDWAESLLWTICNNFRCRWYMQGSSQKVVQAEFNNNVFWQKLTQYVIVGLEVDRAVAAQVYKAAKYSADTLAKHNKKAKGKIGKTSYRMGFVSGLNTKFMEQRRNMPQEVALMIIEPQEVKDFMGKMKLGTAASIGGKVEFFGDAYNSGYHDGKVWEANLVTA